MNLPERGPDQVRIGIAIAVPEPHASELQAARSRAGDPLADLIPPHVTVVGPTVVDASLLPAVGEHMVKVAQEVAPFQVLLRGTGTFRPISPVVFVALAEGIAECEQLERLARSGVLSQELRFNYHPHITIAHDVPDAALDASFEDMAGFEVRFDVDDVCLYEHGDDGVWRPRERFELCGPAPSGGDR